MMRDAIGGQEISFMESTKHTLFVENTIALNDW